jgi:DNA repair protein RadC
MSVLTYERPREKIVNSTVGSLTDHELLQAILGSGSKGARVQHIARRILKLLKKHHTLPAYDTLQAIDGVGPAKAASMVAAFELSRRYSVASVGHPRRVVARAGMLYCQFLSIDNRMIDERWYPQSKESQLWLRYILAAALKQHASQLILYDSLLSAHSLHRLEMLERRQRLIEAAAVVGISIRKYICIQANGTREPL